MAFRGEAVLVCERRFEVELVVRTASEPVAQSRQRARRVQVAVQPTVGLRLVARAVVHVGGELITLAELVAGAPSQRVRQRDLRAQPGLLQICQRALVVVLAEDRVTAGAVIPQETVAAEQREWSALVAEVAADVDVAGGPTPNGEPAAPPFIGLLLEDDVDDSRVALRV